MAQRVVNCRQAASHTRCGQATAGQTHSNACSVPRLSCLATEAFPPEPMVYLSRLRLGPMTATPPVAANWLRQMDSSSTIAPAERQPAGTLAHTTLQPAPLPHAVTLTRAWHMPTHLVECQTVLLGSHRRLVSLRCARVHVSVLHVPILSTQQGRAQHIKNLTCPASHTLQASRL